MNKIRVLLALLAGVCSLQASERSSLVGRIENNSMIFEGEDLEVAVQKVVDGQDGVEVVKVLFQAVSVGRVDLLDKLLERR